jgi:hypothetical protein
VVASALLSREVSLSQLGVQFRRYVSGKYEQGAPIVIFGSNLDDIQKRKTNRNKGAIAHFDILMYLSGNRSMCCYGAFASGVVGLGEIE